MKKEKTINDELIKSIEDSRIYIIVFSKNYASSSWCLDELLKIMECQKTSEQTADPIFYDVEPTEVQKQNGVVRYAFTRHEKKEAAEKWKEAMKQASKMVGWDLKETANGLCFINLSVDNKLVGMEARINAILSSLEMGTNNVRMIGIKGMGGGGKKTLARAVYDKISIHFEGKSFVENVRKVSKASLSSLKKLQKQIVSNVLNKQDITIDNVHDGTNMMKKMMYGRKVLIVLDDVDNIDQLEVLTGSFLGGQNEPQWINALQRLKTVLFKATMEKLELSYDGLEADYKDIFLDVACILKGWDEEDVIRSLKSRGFHTRNGLIVLEQKSLITISDHGSTRTRRPTDRMCLYIDAEEHELRDLGEPANYKAALLDLKSDKWHNAMNVEMQSMKDNEVWELVELPSNGKTIGSKWLFKKKTNMDEVVHTYKARLVAKGYTYTSRIDYEETFSLIANIKAIRILIAIAAHYDYEI
uniref:Toll/interleukin-1 receptor (TIR) domain-containing protein n=1 Tax=Tanacetum cinerariifolium TaxID=118510 RepID=A0A6L2L1Y7_TANCI|nr:Toll/interleukin-1 receptor (TIR) domain-containing protein [Tanacetum cinerariifolium]